MLLHWCCPLMKFQYSRNYQVSKKEPGHARSATNQGLREEIQVKNTFKTKNILACQINVQPAINLLVFTLFAENKLYSQDFRVKSWIFFIIGISIVYVKIKLYTKFDAKMLIRSKVMIDLKKMANFFINAITQKILIGSIRFFLNTRKSLYFKYM